MNESDRSQMPPKPGAEPSAGLDADLAGQYGATLADGGSGEDSKGVVKPTASVDAARSGLSSHFNATGSALPLRRALETDSANSGAQDSYGVTTVDGGSGDFQSPSNGDGLLAAPSDSSGSMAGIGARQTGDNYDIHCAIGKGGMGEVYLARDKRLRRWVAIKRLTSQLANDPRLHERFQIEARSVAQLTHHHIVPIYAMGDDAQGPYIVSEYVAGPDVVAGSAAPPAPPGWGRDLPSPPLTLEAMVATCGKLDVAATVKLGRQLCSALDYAHRHGIVHRDIKPANILINVDREPKLTDFGLAMRLEGQRAADVDDGNTLAGARVLTLGYGAPEQESDASRVDERADIYSLGATLWYALTGQSPRYFRENDVPERLRPILTDAMQRDREKRIATARQLDKRLSRLDASTEQTASAGLAQATGQCAACAYQHVVDPANPLARKFCESCGENLIMACLQCRRQVGVWAKFCGPCGADLDAIARTTAARLQGEKNDLPSLVRQSRFPDAIAALDSAARLDHPLLLQYAKWAEQQLPDLRAQHQAALQQAEAIMASARKYAADHDYARALRTLETIPTPLRGGAFAELKGNAERLANERAILLKTIRHALESNQFHGLRETVLQYRELAPNDPQCAIVLDRIGKHEQQVELDHWNRVSRERSVDAARKYLAAHPQGKHAGETRGILAPLLRNILLDSPADAEARKQYMECRNAALAHRDYADARAASALSFSAVGAAGGTVAGMIAGGVVPIIVTCVVAALGAILAVLTSAARGDEESLFSLKAHCKRASGFASRSKVLATLIALLLGAALVYGAVVYIQYVAVIGVFGGCVLGAVLGTVPGMVLGSTVTGVRAKSDLGPLPTFAYTTAIGQIRKNFLE